MTSGIRAKKGGDEGQAHSQRGESAGKKLTTSEIIRDDEFKMPATRWRRITEIDKDLLVKASRLERHRSTIDMKSTNFDVYNDKSFKEFKNHEITQIVMIRQNRNRMMIVFKIMPSLLNDAITMNKNS